MTKEEYEALVKRTAEKVAWDMLELVRYRTRTHLNVIYGDETPTQPTHVVQRQAVVSAFNEIMNLYPNRENPFRVALLDLLFEIAEPHGNGTAKYLAELGKKS